jgi:hypothetical protein
LIGRSTDPRRGRPRAAGARLGGAIVPSSVERNPV